MKLLKISEIVYLVIAIISIKVIITEWNLDRTRAYIFLGFAVVSIFMFIFRRHYRKKFEARKNKD